jgi:hypothetical protein
MKHIITYNGKTYVFVKDEIDEIHQHFLNRVWWIVKNIDKYPDVDKHTLYNMSFVWSNVVHMGVVYNEKIMQQLETYMIQDNKNEVSIA